MPTYEVRSVPFARHVTRRGQPARREIRRHLGADDPQRTSPEDRVAAPATAARSSTGEVVARFDPTDFRKRLKDGESDRDDRRGEDREGAYRHRAPCCATATGTADLSQAELEKQEKFEAKDTLIFSRNQIIESGIDKQLWNAKRDNAAGGAADRAARCRGRKIELLVLERRKAEIAMLQAHEGLDNAEIARTARRHLHHRARLARQPAEGGRHGVAGRPPGESAGARRDGGGGVRPGGRCGRALRRPARDRRPRGESRRRVPGDHQEHRQAGEAPHPGRARSTTSRSSSPSSTPTRTG